MSDREKIFGVTDAEWLWCLDCERVYWAGEFRVQWVDAGEVIGQLRLEMCPYAGCDGDAVRHALPWLELRGHNNYPVQPLRGFVYPMYPTEDDLVRVEVCGGGLEYRVTDLRDQDGQHN